MRTARSATLAILLCLLAASGCGGPVTAYCPGMEPIKGVGDCSWSVPPCSIKTPTNTYLISKDCVVETSR